MAGHKTGLLAECVWGWIARHETTGKWLAEQAGIPHSITSFIRRGGIPRPPTLMKLADAMQVSRAELLVLAGYVTDADLVAGPASALTEEEEELLALYRGLPERFRALLREVAVGLRQPEGRTASAPPEGTPGESREEGPGAMSHLA